MKFTIFCISIFLLGFGAGKIPLSSPVEVGPTYIQPVPAEESTPALEPFYEDVEAYPEYYEKAYISRSTSSTPDHRNLGGGFFAVMNKTNSWESAISQGKKLGHGRRLIVDVHFNAASVNNSGPVILATSRSKDAGDTLLSEYGDIYKENDFHNGQSSSCRTYGTGTFGFLSAGIRQGVDTIISEVTFKNDEVNGDAIMDYILSSEGLLRTAQAIINMKEKMGYDTVVLFMGHHGDRGNGGTSWESKEHGVVHETVYSNALINAVYFLQSPIVSGEDVAEGRITRYGYPGDPYANANDIRGIGNRNNKLEQGTSISLSPELARRLKVGLKDGDYVAVEIRGSFQVFRVDDSTAWGLKDYRVDLYDRDGLFEDIDGHTTRIFKQRT